jgi:hypothetical protein
MTSGVVAAAHSALGPVGVFLPFPFASAPSADVQREQLGPDKLLVVGLAVVADSDPDRAKATLAGLTS